MMQIQQVSREKKTTDEAFQRSSGLFLPFMSMYHHHRLQCFPEVIHRYPRFIFFHIVILNNTSVPSCLHLREEQQSNQRQAGGSHATASALNNSSITGSQSGKALMFWNHNHLIMLGNHHQFSFPWNKVFIWLLFSFWKEMACSSDPFDRTRPFHTTDTTRKTEAAGHKLQFLPLYPHRIKHNTTVW